MLYKKGLKENFNALKKGKKKLNETEKRKKKKETK